jgi:hypothetical protein
MGLATPNIRLAQKELIGTTNLDYWADKYPSGTLWVGS